MEATASTWWSRKSRKRDYRRNHKRNCAVLKCLADLATDDASLYSVEFTIERPYQPQGYKISYSLSVCRSPSLHSWCSPVASPFTPSSLMNGCPLLSLHRTQSRIGDLDFCLQIAEAIRRIPGLSHAKLCFTVHHWDHGKFIIDHLLNVFLDTVSTERPISVLKQIVLHMSGFIGRPRPDFLQLPNSLPSLEALEIMHRNCFPRNTAVDEANRLASILRSNRSLKSLLFNVRDSSWEPMITALKIIMEPLSGIALTGGSREKDNLVLEKLMLEMEMDNYNPDRLLEGQDVVRAITRALDYTGLGLAVGEFWLSLRSLSLFHLIMRIELGAIVELLVPNYGPRTTERVKEILWLNRGPSVLSLGPLWCEVAGKILSPLIPDQNGHQVNTCVSTLKLLNGSFTYDLYTTTPIVWQASSCTSGLLEKYLEAVAEIMKSGSTVEHLEVTNQCPGFKLSGCGPIYPPEGILNSPAITELRSRLRPGETLRSFTFYGQELEFEELQQQESKQKKVQCLKKLGSHYREEVEVVVRMGRGVGNWEILPGELTSCCTP